MDDIRAELESATASGVAKWILDLSQTSLFTLLSEWSEQFEEITAICDRSKPLEEEARSFDAFIGGSGEFYTSLFGQRQKVGFNLSSPLMFKDSKQSAGIQVADVAAAAAVFAFTTGGDEHADRWRELMVDVAQHGNVLPDKSELDMRSLSVQRNVLLLQELHRRAAGGLSMIDGMTEYIRWLSRQLQVNPVFR